MLTLPLPYKILAALALVVASMGFGWIKGADCVQTQWDAALVKESLAASRISIRQAEAAVRVVTEYVDRVKVVRERAHTLIKEVPVYVTKNDDAACTLNRGFVRLHDAAAQGIVAEPAGDSDAAPAHLALSTAAATVADNYGRCRENAEQLMALQAYIAEMRQAERLE